MKFNALTAFSKSTLIQSLVTVAILCCLPSAFGGLSSNRSILEEASADSDAFRMNAFGSSSDLFTGALTLDNDVYHFDFSTAGIGSVTFRAKTNRTFGISADEITREMPRTVGDWSSQSSSFENIALFPSGGSHRSTSTVLAFASQPDADPIPNLPIIPEPSTWIGAALALVAIGFTQRRRLTRPFARL